MFVIGEREVQNRTVAVRSRKAGDLGVQTVAAIAAQIQAENAERRID
jgi:threonyl-tRNA synthetase